MAIDFKDKVVIITGAGRGLGRAHALGFAARGAAVVVNDLGASVDGAGGSSAEAEALADEITAAGGRAIANGASVTSPAGIEGLVADTMEAFGRIDVLVNNAGILRDRSFHKMSDAEWDTVIDVHLNGTAQVTRAVWPIMRDQGSGRIVMTTSSSGLYGNFGQANYSAAKLGVVGLMNTLVEEGRKTDIRVNAIAPVAWTRMTAAVFPPAVETMVTPERVTPGVLYLASADAPTGVILAAGGGIFAVTKLVETAPVDLGADVTADDIAARFATITDLSTAEPIPNGALQTARFLGALAKR